MLKTYADLGYVNLVTHVRLNLYKKSFGNSMACKALLDHTPTNRELYPFKAGYLYFWYCIWLIFIVAVKTCLEQTSE